ncbi:MAG: hypothetical protein ACK559_42395, partial [bacterium]
MQRAEGPAGERDVGLGGLDVEAAVLHAHPADLRERHLHDPADERAVDGAFGREHERRRPHRRRAPLVQGPAHPRRVHRRHAGVARGPHAARQHGRPEERRPGPEAGGAQV